VRVSFPEVRSSVEAAYAEVEIVWTLWVRVFTCLVEAHSNDNTRRCRESDPTIRNLRF